MTTPQYVLNDEDSVYDAATLYAWSSPEAVQQQAADIARIQGS